MAERDPGMTAMKQAQEETGSDKSSEISSREFSKKTKIDGTRAQYTYQKDI